MKNKMEKEFETKGEMRDSLVSFIRKAVELAMGAAGTGQMGFGIPASPALEKCVNEMWEGKASGWYSNVAMIPLGKKGGYRAIVDVFGERSVWGWRCKVMLVRDDGACFDAKTFEWMTGNGLTFDAANSVWKPKGRCWSFIMNEIDTTTAEACKKAKKGLNLNRQQSTQALNTGKFFTVVLNTIYPWFEGKLNCEMEPYIDGNGYPGICLKLSSPLTYVTYVLHKNIYGFCMIETLDETGYPNNFGYADTPYAAAGAIASM